MQQTILTDAIGYVAAGLVFATFCATRMASLRSLAIASNVAFIGYGFLDGLWPILILHSAGDKVCTAEEAFNLARLAKPPVELHLMDGANHFLFVDPDPRIAIMLRTWLDRFFPVSGARPAS